MNSSDWVAKENECNDSEGNRVRSSPKANVGDPGAEGAEPDGCLDTGGVAMFSEAARWFDAGNRGPGCWRMRRRPEAPRPCSCSGTMGDLAMRSSWPASMLRRFAVFKGGGAPERRVSRLEVLLFLDKPWSTVYWESDIGSKWGASGREPGGVIVSANRPMQSGGEHGDMAQGALQT